MQSPSPPPSPGKRKGKGGGGGAAEKKNMALGARFQKLRGETYYQWGLNSKRGRVELTSQKGGPDSQGLPCFSANVLFLWQHCY